MWQTHLERAARVSGQIPVTDIAAWSVEHGERPDEVDRDQVAVFREVERLLVSARAEASALREAAALTALASAERLTEANADVPGSAGWIAEVQTAVGITAAQAGLDALMEGALSHAATIDGGRRVLAADAPPTVVARAAEIARAVATGPRGSFEVSADAPGAVVFLDDQELGLAPQVVEAPVGRHVLRVTALGWRPYGRVVGVLEGRRLPIDVHLSRSASVASSERLVAAGRALNLDAVAEALVALQRERSRLSSVWLVEIGGGPRDRALLTICFPHGCSETRRLEVDEVPIIVSGARALAASAARLPFALHRDWLLERVPVEPPPPPPTPWWERWYFWVATGVVAGAAGAAAYTLLRPEPEQRLRVVVDFGDVARAP